jgi:hypothetical protein
MATLPNSTRQVLADALVDLVDAGVGAGYMDFQDSGHVSLVQVDFAGTAFGAASATGVATMASAPKSGVAAAAGTIDHGHFFDGSDAEVLAFTVSTSGAEVNLSSLAIAISDNLEIASLTVTQPAS